MLVRELSSGMVNVTSEAKGNALLHKIPVPAGEPIAGGVLRRLGAPPRFRCLSG